MAAKELALVLGGARGGKSSFADRRARTMSDRVLFVATATGIDDEMRERIARHRAERPDGWRTLEAPLEAAPEIERALGDAEVVLFDDLTLYVANMLVGPDHEMLDESKIDFAGLERRLDAEVDALLEVYERGDASWLIVSNEVGMGLVPEYAFGRWYRDLLGFANQRIARRADRVYFLLAGVPLELRSISEA